MQDLAIKEYLHQIWKRRKVVLVFALSVVGLVTLFTLQQQKIYRAVTTVEIGAETPDAAFFQEVVNTSPYGWWSALRYYETQYQILRSRDLLTKAAERALKSGIVSGGSVASWTAHLQGGLSVKGEENSRIAQVFFDDVIPERAQKLSILIAEVYAEQNLTRKLQGVDDAVNWLNERLKEIRTEKASQEAELQKYKEQYKVVSFSDKENSTRANLIALTESLNRLKGQRIEIEAQYSKLNELVKKSKRVEDLLGVLTSDLLTKFERDLADLRSRKSELTHKYMEKHPEMVRLNAHISEVEGLIRQEVANEVSRLRTKFLLAKAEEDSVAQALDQQKMETLQLEDVTRRLADIQVVTNTNQQIFETLQKKIKEADLSALIRSNNIRVMDRALLPNSPIRPDVSSNILLSIAIGLLGGIALALAMEYLDDTFKTHEDVERYLKLSVMGVIPHFEQAVENGSTSRLEFLPATEPASTVAEFYRTLRTNVLFSSRTRAQNRLLVVSTGPSEGKTITTINLAVTLAQIGQRTVVVDLDFRRPKVHTAFEVPNQNGMTNVLLGEIALRDAIRHSEIPNLDYILAGSIPPNPAELMASLELRLLLENLSASYDRVIIDSSPIAPVTDAVVLSQAVHSVLMIVRAGKTHRRAVFYACEQLQGVKAHVMGVVLNDVDIRKSTYGSYQYYKYGYSTYSDGSAKRPSTDKSGADMAVN
jgi:capsular exopolysaccharide synthesis family protein